MSHLDSSTDRSLDPSLVGLLDAQYVKFYNDVLRNVPLVNELPWTPELRRTLTAPGGPSVLPVARIQDFQLPNFKIPAMYPAEPDAGRPLPVLIWYHGGGNIMGSLDAGNAIFSRVCNAAQCVVVAVDYRLAPEFTFPTAHEDAWDSFCWVFEHGRERLYIDPSRFGLAGASNGATLALHVAQRAGMMGRNIQFVLLGVPVCDNTASAETYHSWDVYRYAPGLPAAKQM